MEKEFIFITIISIWLLALSLAGIWVIKFFRKLSKGTKEGNLDKILEKILNQAKDNKKGISILEGEIENIKKEGLSHIQKVGLVRFNPFEEIGGDHSFSASFLDGKDTGIVVTALHTRERTRVYSKEISNGKSKLDLSKEEMKALEKAKKGVN